GRVGALPAPIIILYGRQSRLDGFDQRMGAFPGQMRLNAIDVIVSGRMGIEGKDQKRDQTCSKQNSHNQAETLCGGKASEPGFYLKCHENLSSFVIIFNITDWKTVVKCYILKMLLF